MQLEVFYHLVNHPWREITQLRQGGLLLPEGPGLWFPKHTISANTLCPLAFIMGKGGLGHFGRLAFSKCLRTNMPPQEAASFPLMSLFYSQACLCWQKLTLGISQLGSLNCVVLDNKHEFPLGWCVGWLHWCSHLPHVPLIPRAHVEEQQYRGVPCSWCREGAREGESKLMSLFGASAWTWMLCCLMGRWPKQSPG